MIARFLARSGWSDATSAPLAGDASNRRYERLSHPRLGPAVLMDAPPEKGEDVRPFVSVTRHLREAGLSAPEVLAEDAAAGLLLLEDLGDDLYARVCARDPSLEPCLYAAAIDLLAGFHRHPPPAGLPPYDLAAYLAEAELITGWYLPAATGTGTPPDLAAEYRALITGLCAPLDPVRDVLVMRDYHAENLLWLPERTGIGRVGLLDYQDALAGHPAYDLVSLLEDARRDTSPALQEAMIARYLAATGADPEAFRLAYATLGAQRNLKIIGIFTRLWKRDGKPAYLDHLPRLWTHLARDLAHPALAPLKRWVTANLPEPTADIRARIKALPTASDLDGPPPGSAAHWGAR